jgi:hypothetical protein
VCLLDGSHEITDGVDAVGNDVGKFEARHLIFYRDYQFEAIEPVSTEVIAKTGFVSDALRIDAEMSGDDFADPVVDILLHDRISFVGRNESADCNKS